MQSHRLRLRSAHMFQSQGRQRPPCPPRRHRPRGHRRALRYRPSTKLQALHRGVVVVQRTRAVCLSFVFRRRRFFFFLPGHVAFFGPVLQRPPPVSSSSPNKAPGGPWDNKALSKPASGLDCINVQLLRVRQSLTKASGRVALARHRFALRAMSFTNPVESGFGLVLLLSFLHIPSTFLVTSSSRK